MTVDPSRIRDQRGRLSWERHAQIRSLREIAASAIGAAGQVRDVRLDQLEHPPVADTSILFDLIVELALTPLIAGATKLLVKHVTDRIVVAMLGKAVKGAGLTELTTTVAVSVPHGFAVATARSQLPDRQQDPDLWRELWTGLVSGFAGSVLSYGQTKAVSAVKPPAKPSSESFVSVAADSPASLVEEAVLRGCALHEQAIGVVFDSYERDLDDDSLTDRQVAELDAFLSQLASTPGIFGDDARRLRLFFERCIWCLALPSIATFDDEPSAPTEVDESFQVMVAPRITVRKLTIGTARLSHFWWRVGGGCDTPGGLGVRALGVR